MSSRDTSQPTPPSETEGSAARRPFESFSGFVRGRVRSVGRLAVFLAFVLTFAVFAVLRSGTFLSEQNLKSILWISAPLAILSFGLTIVLSMGDFDLSIGPTVGFTGAVAAYLMSSYGVGWAVAVGAAVGVGIGVGVVIGLLTAYGGGSPFIITLGMGTVVTGLNYTLTGGTTIFEHISGTYIRLGRGELLGFRYHVWVALVVLLAIYVIHDRTEVGRYMRAVGGNARTALLSGLNVRRLRLYGFVIVGVCAAIAGILITASAGTSTPQDGLELLLPAYAAAFIGSASFRPGTFNVFGTAIGILFLAVLQNGLTLMSAQTSTIYLIQGSILIIAVLLVRLGGPVRYQSHV